MKIQCWSCSEPRDDQDEFCPQCGAGPAPVHNVEETKPEIIETLGEPIDEKPPRAENVNVDAIRQKIIDGYSFEE